MRLQWAPVKKRAGKAATHLPAHMIKLTETREITPYVWVHPNAER
jgi:hypothetical protein